MAQYQHLPIYKATYDLLTRVTQATAGFSKAYKYSLGDRLRARMGKLLRRHGHIVAIQNNRMFAERPLL